MRGVQPSRMPPPRAGDGPRRTTGSRHEVALKASRIPDCPTAAPRHAKWPLTSVSAGQGPSRFGGAEGIRTPDPFHAMEVRYQLRHSPGSPEGDAPRRGLRKFTQ